MTLIMSVSGVRGIVGRTMTTQLAADMGVAFGSHLGRGAVVVGRDSRPSGALLHSAMCDGLIATGRDVIDVGVVTTPGVALQVRELGAAGGVVITASHNPSEWNGIKFLTAEGCAPPAEVAERIFARHRHRDFHIVYDKDVGTVRSDASTHERHVGRVQGIVDVEAIRAGGFKVVLDSVNGAGGVGGRMLLERLGCEVVHINGEPTGEFAHTPEPTAENLTGLCAAVPEHGADVGFAQDPDADRLAVVDETGRYIGEEYTLALAAKFVLSRMPGPIAANLSTSRMIDDIAAGARGAVVYRTPVGEANVARAVLERGCVLGGEGNGGVIDPRVVPVRDSFVAMGLALNLLAADLGPGHRLIAGATRPRLSTIVDALPRYVMIKRKFEMERPEIDAWLAGLRERLDGKHNDADGLRIDWPEGWVHVRPSNTEPIARIIAEARDAQTAEALVERARALK